MAIGETLLRLPGVLVLRGVGRSTHYNDVATGLFTRPVAVGQRARAWPASEVNAINGARIAGKGDAQIRTLVKHLEGKRTAGASPASIAGL